MEPSIEPPPTTPAGARSARAAVVDENVVRAAAGLTMAMGAVAFGYAYFTGRYAPLQTVAALLLAEFLTRLTFGLPRSRVGLLARAMTSMRRPEWVPARPQRFAWKLALGMTAAMTVITNSGIRGLLPRTICLICLTLMWMESALGLCLGCVIHGVLVRRGWAASDRTAGTCTGGVCEPPAASRVA